ncbi:hypothetical protein VNI00_018917 [Paramarasmius palmivorus]|uniref:Uncharacterized protein n=1 Tax=Paramarasmius palmivorus TaxID=297713 RepID=A0AAW0ASV8_9AGAR
MSDLVKIDSDEDDSESSSNELSDGRTSGGDKESDSGIEDMEGGDEEEESDSYNGSDMDMSDD